MPATDYTANLIATAMAHGEPYQGPAEVDLALVTTTPTPTTPGTEITLGSYARVTYAQSGWTNDGAGSLTNPDVVAFPQATADYDAEVVAVEAYDDSGTRLWYIPLTTPQTVLSGQTPEWLPGDLVLQVA